MASDFSKPDGLTVVREEDAKNFLAPLPVGRLIGVGKKTEKKLKEMGIETIGELASYDPPKLADAFGKFGLRLYLMAQGIDESEVREKEERKSMSREITLDEDTDDLEFVLRILDSLCDCLYKEVIKKDLGFKTVTLKIRYEDFETHVFSKTLPRMADLKLLKDTARELLLANFEKKKIRLVGVRVSNLVRMKGQKRLYA